MSALAGARSEVEAGFFRLHADERGHNLSKAFVFFAEMGERRHSKGLCRFCGDGFAQRNQPRMQDEGLLP